MLENTDYSALTLPGCTSRPEWLAPAGAKCALTLTVVESGEALDCLWEYAGEYLTEPDAAALAALFEQALDRLVEGRHGHPGRAGGRLPQRGWPSPAAAGPRRWTTPRWPRDSPARLRRNPDAPALRSGGRTVSYAQLDGYAGALAAELLANYPVPADGRPCCVALHLEASVEHVVALLALARLNLTIVPLDPEYPPAQLQHILGQINPLCVLLPPDSRATIDTGSLPRHPVRLRSSAAPVVAEPDGASIAGRSTRCSPPAPPARPRGCRSPTGCCATCCSGSAPTAGWRRTR